MRIHEKIFICRECGAAFTKKARKAFYCETCGKKVRSRREMEKRAAADPHVALGVGSGGNQYGENNHQFKDGLSNYRGNFLRDNPQQRCCEICGDDRNIVIHHLDQNRRNNKPENLIMLCKSCHAKVHRNVRHLGVVPEIDRGSEDDHV